MLQSLPSALNGQSLFYAAWACGVVGLTVGPDVVVAVGGALLLIAALLVASNPSDRLLLRFERAGVLFGRGTRPFVAAVLGSWALGGSSGV